MKGIVMAVKVAGELYESITGQLFEIGRQLRQPNGYPFDPAELQKFLQRAVEGKFVDGAVAKSTPDYLTRLYVGETISLPSTTRTTTIAEAAEAADVFDYIDSDFKNWGTDKSSKNMKSSKMQVFEMCRDGTFAQLFGSLGDLDRLTLTQGQIIAFCRQHRNKLRQDVYGTFFLFRVGNERFVAYVFVFGGQLSVYCFRFSNDDDWGADCRHRVVVPQLVA